MKITAVIMAGGKGERFWPKSRYGCPKQFLSLVPNGKTMIQLTVERILPLIDINDIFIVTNKDYIDLVKSQIPDIPAENILAEPVSKNTAPCIGFAAAVISRKYKDCVMLVLPSDHLIKNSTIFIDTLKSASKIAANANNIVTIGITPTHPETGYGYINFFANEKMDNANAYKVRQFVEKPTFEIACEYLLSGTYLWNSGMFVWKLSTILDSFKNLLPKIYEGLQRIQKDLETDRCAQVLLTEFEKFDSISIDCGIMEKAKNIYTIPGSFGWDDVGSWLSLERINKPDASGNTITGEAITINTKNTIIWGGKRLITTIGLQDIVIVDTDDVTFICNKNNTQEIKKVIEQLKISDRTDLL